MKVNYLDIGVVLILAFYFFKGYRKGIVASAINMTKSIAALFCCNIFYKGLTFQLVHIKWLNKLVSQNVSDIAKKFTQDNFAIDIIKTKIFEAISIAFIYISVIILISIFIKLLNKIIKEAELDWINKLIGGIVGIIQGLLIEMILLTIANPFLMLNQNSEIINDLNRSLFIKYLYMYNFILDYFNQAIEIINHKGI